MFAEETIQACFLSQLLTFEKELLKIQVSIFEFTVYDAENLINVIQNFHRSVTACF